jgi:hypothetical protein
MALTGIPINEKAARLNPGMLAKIFLSFLCNSGG